LLHGEDRKINDRAIIPQQGGSGLTFRHKLDFSAR